MFTFRYASAPSLSQRERNSSVPNTFGSSTLVNGPYLDQYLFLLSGLESAGPMPFLQSYPSANRPPGHLMTGGSRRATCPTRSSRITHGPSGLPRLVFLRRPP